MLQKLQNSKYFLVTFALLMSLCILAAYFLVERKYQIEYIKMERIILNQSNKLNTVLSKLLYKTQALSALVIQHNGHIQNFEKVASTILDDPAILNILIAPDGVVSNVYPLQGNEPVLGLNFLSKGDGNKEALDAKNTGMLVLGGPFTLVQGGQALVGRLPVFTNGPDGEKRFWGLVSVTLKFPQALDGAELNKLGEQGLAYEIWRISPDTGARQRIAASDYAYNKNAPFLEMPLQILNAQWFFRLSPVRLWYQYPETWFYVCLGLFLSALMASLVQHNQDLSAIRSRLENMAYQDVLTGTMNRRGLFEKLEKLTAPGSGETFFLYYMDLNNFKAINDNYGHNLGDRVLQIFTETLQKHMKFPHFLARIGGDEFTLIVPGAGNEEKICKAFEAVRADLDEPVPAGGDSVRISFSLGTAVYPRDGQNVDALLSRADSDMYKAKRDAQNAV